MDRRQYMRRSGLLVCGITSLAGCSAIPGPFQRGGERFVRQSIDEIAYHQKSDTYVEGGLYGGNCHRKREDEGRQREPHRCGIYAVAFVEPAQLKLIDFDRLKSGEDMTLDPELFDFVVGTDFDDSVLLIIQRNPGDAPRTVTTVNRADETLRIYLGFEEEQESDGILGRSQHLFVRLARDPLPDSWILDLAAVLRRRRDKSARTRGRTSRSALSKNTGT